MAESAYMPTPYWSGYAPPSMFCVAGNCSGNGDPSNDAGLDGYTYVNEQTGDFWVKSEGVWIPGGSGSGGLTGNSNPEGVVEGEIGQHFWDNVARIDYIKTSNGGGTTGWEPFLGI